MNRGAGLVGGRCLQRIWGQKDARGVGRGCAATRKGRPWREGSSFRARLLGKARLAVIRTNLRTRFAAARLVGHRVNDSRTAVAGLSLGCRACHGPWVAAVRQWRSTGSPGGMWATIGREVCGLPHSGCWKARICGAGGSDGCLVASLPGPLPCCSPFRADCLTCSRIIGQRFAFYLYQTPQDPPTLPTPPQLHIIRPLPVVAPPLHQPPAYFSFFSTSCSFFCCDCPRCR